jgi:hypothetical protein
MTLIFMYNKLISSKQLFALDINLLCWTCVDLKNFSVFTMKIVTFQLLIIEVQGYTREDT